MYLQGIFPLELVLFPDSFIKLHIFEERYKILMSQCLESRRLFGINLIVSSKIFEVGTSAEIFEIEKIYDDGRMDIIVKGNSRFLLRNYRKSDIGYFTGDYEEFLDKKDFINTNLVDECLDLFSKVLLKSGLILSDFPEVTNSLDNPSFTIAQKIGFNNIQKYKLLTLNSENERLKFIIENLNKLYQNLDPAELSRNLIKYDGYLRYF